MTETTELAVLPRAALPTILAADTNDVFGKLARELADFEPDATTPQGRAEIGSKADKVGRAKMELVRLANGLTEGWRASTAAVVAERKVIEERMNSLRKQIEAPRDEYNAREANRVKAHEAAIADFVFIVGAAAGQPSSQEVGELIDKVADMHADRDWQEFAGKAQKERQNTLDTLRAVYQTAKTREDEAEAARVAEHHRNLAKISEAGVFGASFGGDIRIEDIANRVAWLNNWKEHDWDDFAEDGTQAITASLAKLTTLRGEIEVREAEVRQVREEQIAREAAEAARQAAEAEAARQAREAEERAQAALAMAEALRVHQEKAAAEELARVEGERVTSEARAEQSRVVGHHNALVEMDALTSVAPGSSSVVIRHIIQRYEEWSGHNREWQEFSDVHEADLKRGREHLSDCLAMALANETAEENERQRVAAELANKRETKRISDHESAIGDFTFLMGAVAGQPSSVEVGEVIAIMKNKHAGRNWEEFEDRATKERQHSLDTLHAVLGTAQARERKIAEGRAASEKAAAIEAERARVAKEAAAQKAKDHARMANLNHQRKINGEVLADLLVVGEAFALTEDACKAIIVAIAKNEIRHCRVEY